MVFHAVYPTTKPQDVLFHALKSACNRVSLGDVKELAKWLPVDVYVGGIEHAIMHLLYARFITRALADILGETSFPKEPFKHLICQGLVEGKTYKCPETGRYLKPDELNIKGRQVSIVGSDLAPAESWEKMSKSKYNGVDPTQIVQQYGSDALRIYLMFKAPPEVSLPWSDTEIAGPVRWLKRLHSLSFRILEKKDAGSNVSNDAMVKARDVAIRSIERAFDIKTHKLNTAVAALMKFSNVVEDNLETSSAPALKDAMKDLSVMLFPIAPCMASEIYQLLTGSELSLQAKWPTKSNKP